jgi:hypothetical protein
MCNFCDRLLRSIQDENLIKYCTLICLETHPNKFPKFITNVPTIIAEHLTKPLVGLEAIEWTENIKYFHQTTNNIQNNSVIYPDIRSLLDLYGYNKTETTSISDKYTNIGDINIEKQMLEYDKINIDAPITNDISNKKISDIKLSNNLQNKKMKELITLRKIQLMSKLSGTSEIKQQI